jgi:hypothetical protein
LLDTVSRKLRPKAPQKTWSSLRKSNDNPTEMGQFAPDQIVQPRGCVVTFRPRICHVLSLLRIHNPDCKHCAAHLTCGNELRKRLEELNEPRQPVQFQSLRQGVEMALLLAPSERRKAS